MNRRSFLLGLASLPLLGRFSVPAAAAPVTPAAAPVTTPEGWIYMGELENGWVALDRHNAALLLHGPAGGGGGPLSLPRQETP